MSSFQLHFANHDILTSRGRAERARGDEPGRAAGGFIPTCRTARWRVDEIPGFLGEISGLRKEYGAKGIALEYGEPIEAADGVVLKP
ncbi:hypothetical protein ACWDUX_24825 [Streptomyces sp. NPDC003444]